MELLIDGDIILYSVALRCERNGSFPSPEGDRVHFTYGKEDEAAGHVRRRIDGLVAKLGATQISVALTDSAHNFRKRIVAGYKSNRVAGRKPVLFHAMRELLRDEFAAVQIPGLEADDVLGVWATSRKTPSIVCSIDKDMKTLPGEHYNWDRGERFTITEEEAEYNHFLQTLMGDRTDGYPGAPGIGEVKAKRLLDEECSWEQVVKGYAKAYKSELSDSNVEALALDNARMAYILRSGDTRAPRQVRLWTPDGLEEEWLQLEDAP